MEKLIELKNKFFQSNYYQKISFYLNKFFTSDLYIIVLFLIAIINWKLKIFWLVLISFCIFIFLIYLFQIPKVRMLPIAFALMIAIRLDLITNHFWTLMLIALVLSCFFIYNFFKKKPKFNNGIFLSFLFILFSKIFSLVNTPVLIDSLKGISLFSFYTILYLYLFNLFNEESKEYNRDYLAKTFIYLSIALFLEIIIYYIEYGLGENIIRFFGSNDVHFGWSSTSTFAALYLLIMPILFYYYTLHEKRYHILVIIIINILMLHLLLSQGAYLVTVILSLPLILKVTHDVKEKANFIITVIYFTVIILLFLLIIGIPTGYVKELFTFLNTKGLTTKEKTLISNIGFSVFQRYPLFGGGANSAKYYLEIATNINNYENFIIQTLANTGIIGMIAFLYYLVEVLRYCLIKNRYNSYVLIVVIGVIIQGLMETVFYNPLVMIVLVFLFSLLTFEKEKQN